MVFINVDYHVWGKLSNMAYLVAITMLVLVLLLPESHAVNGAKRWFSIGPLQFQVSDFARMALILFIARHAEQAGTAIKDHKVYLKLVGFVFLVSFLILVEPGFSTASIIGMIGIVMLFMSGARVTHLLGLGLLALPVAAFAALRMPHSRARVAHFMQGHEHTESMGYQAYQSLIGLGNGGLFGVGIGKGEQKFFYLPEPHTDFVISILGEEIGFIGLVVVAAVFTFVVYRGMKISLRAPDKTGQLMAFGFTFTIAVYAILHACVAVGLMPTTGVPLPFISYGGMNLVFMACSMGIVLNISSQTRHGAVAGDINPAMRLSRMGS
jgi:cell division protein FtsW